jgi:2-methylcitrate dehydratase PrpD
MMTLPQSASAKLVGLAASDVGAAGARAAHYWQSLPVDAARRAAAGDRFAQAQRAMVRADALPGPCAIIGLEGRFAVRDAAFANGSLMAAGASAPVAAIVAVVGALAEELGCDEPAALGAVAFGLAVFDRLERAAGPGMRARGHLAEGVLGAPAAAAAACHVIGLSEAKMVDALGIAGSLSSGSREWQGDDADLLAGWMARSAILAARLAETGFSGAAEVFEGRKGLFNAYAGPGNYTLAPLVGEADQQVVSLPQKRS